MTKREAFQRVDKGDLTWGHLKHFIAQCYDQDMSVASAVNPQLTRGQALDILTAGMAARDDNELVISPRFTQHRNAVGSLSAVNVLRETHWRVSKIGK